MIQEEVVYSGKVKIDDNQYLYEDEIRNLVMNKLQENNVVLESNYQIVYDVSNSEISFSVFYGNDKEKNISPESQIIDRINILRKEFYLCDENDYENRENLLLEMENLLDNYYNSLGKDKIKDYKDIDGSIISLSDLKEDLSKSVQRYNEIDSDIALLKKELSKKLDNENGVLGEDEIIGLESDYLNKISDLNRESVQCLMHIDLIENRIYTIEHRENEHFDSLSMENIQLVVSPQSIYEGDCKKIFLSVKQIVELRIKSKLQPQRVLNASEGFDERKSTGEEQDKDMILDFTVRFDPIDDSTHDEIYVLEDNGDYYVSSEVLKRFNISSNVDLTYNDRLYYKISNSDYQYIVNNKNNGYSSYEIFVETLTVDKDNNDINVFNESDEQINEVFISSASTEKKFLDIYQYDGSDDIYILKSVCVDNNIPFSNTIAVDGQEYVLINSMNKSIFMSHFSDYDFNYHTIQIPVNNNYNQNISFDSVINKLFLNLVFPSSKKPGACNVKVTRDFIGILQNSEDGFNIVCSMGKASPHASKSLLKYFASSMFNNTSRGSDFFKKFEERVEGLTPEELAVLTTSGNEDYDFLEIFEIKR